LLPEIESIAIGQFEELGLKTKRIMAGINIGYSSLLAFAHFVAPVAFAQTIASWCGIGCCCY
jgi:hypothetical protein